MRNLSILVALMAAVILLLALTVDIEFFLPVIGAAAILLFTFALELNPSEEVRPTVRPDEDERHLW